VRATSRAAAPWDTALVALVESVNVSRGGVPKRRVLEALVTAEGVAGDRQSDLRFHGGPKRAVTLFSTERIEALRGEGHPIAAGTAGENLTVSGLDWERIEPGARFRVGEAEIEITSYAAPCAKIRGSFADGDYERVAQKRHPGWSRLCARVVKDGWVRVGDAITPLPPDEGA
jgi:MOSC domain-containing protein YiiM